VGLEFLTPSAAFLALAIVAPLAALMLAERRARRARALLGLPEPGILGRLPAPLALCAIGGLVALAAAQPVLRETRARYARTDAEAIFAFDVSRSMLAARSPGAPTRLERAKGLANRLRAGIRDVPVGVASFTDRALPHLFPSPSAEAFRATVARAVGIERPPPRAVRFTATSFEALARLPTAYFAPNLRRRLLVVFTDGESRDFDDALLRRRYGAQAGLATVVVQVGGQGERIFGPNGRPEAEYRPEAPGTLRRLLAATGARVVPEGRAGEALEVGRTALGSGPRRRIGAIPATTELAPFLVLAALCPLAVLIWRRNL